MLTIASLLLFARSKPAEESYSYTNPKNCPIAQFLKETGLAVDPNVFPAVWYDLSLGDSPINDIDPRISNGSVDKESPVSASPMTWGALAQRLEFEDFLDFAWSKPKGETYDYVDNKNCAFAQYLKSIGVENPSVVPDHWRDRNTGKRYDYDPRIDTAAAAAEAGDNVGVIEAKWSWGALVKRLEAAA